MKQENSSMNTNTQILILAVFLALGSGCGPANSGSSMQSAAGDLRIISIYWERHGRPNNFNTAEAAYSVSGDPSYFVYTNQVRIESKTYQCQFGSRSSAWPGGVLAITDDKKTLWIPDKKDVKVTVSPGSHLRVPY